MKDNNAKTIMTKGKQLVISPVLMAKWLDIKEVIVITTVQISKNYYWNQLPIGD